MVSLLALGGDLVLQVQLRRQAHLEEAADGPRLDLLEVELALHQVQLFLVLLGSDQVFEAQINESGVRLTVDVAAREDDDGSLLHVTQGPVGHLDRELCRS